MTGRTTIEWTWPPGYIGAVWNPTVGCTRVSAGCDNCYAFALHDKRYASNLDAARAAGLLGPAYIEGDGYITTTARGRGDPLPFPKQYDLPFSHVQLLPERLDVPFRTRRPTCYFVDSMADLFHEDVPDEYIGDVFDSMLDDRSRRHRFLILTKRPERMRVLAARDFCSPLWAVATTTGRPPENVWLGTSVEDQRSADERIPYLLATPAAVRFLSCEPLLGPIDLTCKNVDPATCGSRGFCDASLLAGISWLIIGGESGSRARPMDLAWARDLVAQGRAANVSPFVKQLGSKPILNGPTIDMGTDIEDCVVELRESHGRDPAEWPEDLRVREWPGTPAVSVR